MFASGGRGKRPRRFCINRDDGLLARFGGNERTAVKTGTAATALESGAQTGLRCNVGF
jgi:hypothetical protein